MGMKKFFYYVAILLTFVGQVNANVINVENVTIPQGEQQEINVLYSLDKADAYSGYAFKLIMPTGISTVKDKDGYPVYALDENNNGFNMNVTASDGFGALPKNASVTIDGTSGILLTLTLQADASLEVGSTHVVNISSIMLTEKVDDSQQSVYLEDVSFIVTISEPTDKHILLDENGTTAPAAATGVDVRVKRTIKAGEWSTICLPFAMSEAQCKEAFGSDVQIAEFTGAESEFDDADNVVGITVSFSDVSAIEANTPYIIKVGEAVSEFTVDGVDITPDEDEAYVEFDNGKTGSRRVVYSGFYGTYHAGTVLDENTLFLSDNQFWYSAGLTRMKAFRAYFDFLDVLTEVEEAQARILLSFGDGGTTGVGDALRLMNNGRVNSEESASAVYNLKGQRVAQPSKGLYIKDGRKVVVK